MSNIEDKSQRNRFAAMRQRCLNSNDASYPDYGGRGIRICQGWSTFQGFVKDVGHCPSSLHSLDRKDNDGHYSCGHCDECVKNNWPRNWRWATAKEQSGNTRWNVRITKNGETKIIADWAETLQVPSSTLYVRRHRGVKGESILATVKPRRKSVFTKNPERSLWTRKKHG